MESVASKHGLNIVPSLCGHGISHYFHGPPQILHYAYDDDSSEPPVMLENMIFTIEPVLCEGDVDAVVLEDGWSIVTADNGRCSQFEHTIRVTQSEAEILT